ncbi:pyridoxal phosphate-dependent aminotransferase [Nakamurella lactea]|uniref:pyridoxal phosphate-dependent aminotransferase n=1 Tax=Nakamurella lactea TaxID=459515 RepID=UPI00055C2F45|nr:pyridoxal phosphate-dependent aminotransferase [Nakamurella lactea]
MTEPLVRRLRPFTSTIFAEMSALAVSTGAINLGQGFPDTDGPASMLAAAQQAIADGANQYPPGPGIPELRQAIAEARLADYGQRFNPDTEVLVTVGATEAIAAAVLALIEPGDEVIVLEPFYDSYPAAVAMAHGVLVPVRLRPCGDPAIGRFALDPQALADAVTDRTRLILLNSPHNPTGTVLTHAELAAVAAVAIDRDLIVVTDEVYEYLTFADGDAAGPGTGDGAADGARPVPHLPIGTLPGMAERTLTVSSAGKSFNVTGWKIGWVCGPAPLVAAVRAVKQFLTFVGGAPFQPAVAGALRTEREWVGGLRKSLQDKRDRLCDGLTAAGFEVVRPQGTYFVVADIRPMLRRAGSAADTDGLTFCRTLPDRCGVVAVPQQVFYADPAAGAHFVRFAFCKRDEVIDEAVRRLAGSSV